MKPSHGLPEGRVYPVKYVRGGGEGGGGDSNSTIFAILCTLLVSRVPTLTDTFSTETGENPL